MGFLSDLFGSILPKSEAAQAERSAQAQALLERALGAEPGSSGRDARRKAAIELVLANQTAMGREAWLSIARDYPGELAFALEQLGVCYHLEGNYGAALESYEAALRLGADAGHLSGNIQKARKGLANLG